MPYCPYCNSRTVSKNSKISHGVAKGIGLAIGLGLSTLNHTMGHAFVHKTMEEKFKKYHCDSCGKDFD